MVQGGEGADTIKIINPERVLQGQFDRIGIASSPGCRNGDCRSRDASAKAAEPQRQTALVSFELGTQEYALPLERVREIVPMPKYVSEIAGSETAVLGVVTSRNRLLPLVSLRALLGLREPDGRASGKVIVVSMGNGSVGIVADRTREILRIDPALIDPAPALLTRGAGEAEIESICRIDGGKRLVAVLSPDRLFRSDLVSKVLSEAGNDNDSTAVAEGDMNDEQFIVFKLGAQEYGLPISAVEKSRACRSRLRACPRRLRSSTASSTSGAPFFRSWICAGASASCRVRPRAAAAFWSWPQEGADRLHRGLRVGGAEGHRWMQFRRRQNCPASKCA